MREQDALTMARQHFNKHTDYNVDNIVLYRFSSGWKAVARYVVKQQMVIKKYQKAVLVYDNGDVEITSLFNNTMM